jgi:hypothetical protein
MSRTYRKGSTGPGRDRHLSVRAVRRTPVDVRKLSRALIELAIAEAAAEAAASADGRDGNSLDAENHKESDD